MAREEISRSVLRLTSKEKAKEQLGFLDHNPLTPEQKQTQYQTEISVIKNADVVCTTTNSAANAILKKVRFETVIFDEAGMCLDPDILIPIIHGSQQLILVGDHKQLGPVVQNRECEKKAYTLSLMLRLIHQGIHPKILTEQYRMHPSLAEFPSKVFYDNKLKSGLKAEDRFIQNNFLKWPNENVPLLYWDQESQEEYYHSGISYYNRSEIGNISFLLQRMYNAGIKSKQIGIITPYLGQQIHLISMLPSKCNIKDSSFLEELEIASVDAFQGREKDFIIFSTVRANTSFDIGFLKDSRRLCVSLTRCRYGLIIVGNAKTFSKNKLWCDLISHCQSINVFCQGTPDNFIPSFFSPQYTASSQTDELETENKFTI